MIITFKDNKIDEVFKRIMRNKTLSIESKAIYSYLVSFADDVVIPDEEVIADELNLSKINMQIYIKELEDEGIIDIWK